MRRLKTLVISYSALVLILLGLMVVSLSTGDSRSGLMDVVDSLLGRADETVRFIIVTARLPRIVVSLLAGSSLALSGALLQTLTRNPLADSGILGINAGAGFVVTLLLIFLKVTSPQLLAFLPLLAVLGGCLTICLVYVIAHRRHQPISPSRLIVAGVAISSMLSGLMIALMTYVDRYRVAYVVKWFGGAFSGDDWPTIARITPFLLLLWVLVYWESPNLNILALNDLTAETLGLNLKSVRLRILVLSTALAALSVILAGNISFIGLVAGHIGRRLVGANHRNSLPLIALIGAIILLLGDTIVRVFLVGTEIPTGIMVSILGAPYFLYVMHQKKQGSMMS